MSQKVFDISNLVISTNPNAIIYAILILIICGTIGTLIMIGLILVDVKYIKNRNWSIAYKVCWVVILMAMLGGIIFIFIWEAKNYQLQISPDVLEQIKIDVKQEFNIDLPTNYNDWIRIDDSMFPNWFKNNYWPNIIDTLIKYPIG